MNNRSETVAIRYSNMVVLTFEKANTVSGVSSKEDKILLLIQGIVVKGNLVVYSSNKLFLYSSLDALSQYACEVYLKAPSAERVLKYNHQSQVTIIY